VLKTNKRSPVLIKPTIAADYAPQNSRVWTTACSEATPTLIEEFRIMLTQSFNTPTAQLETNFDEQAQFNPQISTLPRNCNGDHRAIALEIPLSVAAHLLEVAQQAQAWYESEQGEYYAVLDLAQAFTKWMESCIEELAIDAFEHCLSGNRNYAFNRRAFEQAVERLEHSMLIEPKKVA
jgi:hypothetical protein